MRGINGLFSKLTGAAIASAVVLATLATAASLLLASPAAASTHRPAIKTFAISGHRPDGVAGVIKLKIAVRGAKTCTLAGPVSVIGTGWQGPCSARSKTLRVWIAANLTETRQTYRLKLIAHGSGGTSSRTLTITIPGEGLRTGIWFLLIGSSPEEIAVQFERNGTLFIPKEPKDIGTWTYEHHVLKFDLFTTTSPTVIYFEGTGAPGGPFVGTGKAGTETGPFSLKHI